MTDGKREVGEGTWVVLDLVELYFGSWKCVVVDNFFTSVALAKELFEKGITITGKLCCNKWEITWEYLLHSKREEYSGIFGFTDNMAVVAYLPKKRTV